VRYRPEPSLARALLSALGHLSGQALLLAPLAQAEDRQDVGDGADGHDDDAEGHRPPLLSRSQMGTLSDDELKDYNDIRCVWTANPNTIRTPQLAPTFELLDEIMASSIYDADHIRGAAVINAAPALGKTTIATAYARRYHGRAIPRGTVRTPEDHRRLPMVCVPLSEGVPLKSLNQKLLRFYGHPTATHCTRAKLGSLVADFVHSCATGMMVMA